MRDALGMERVNGLERHAFKATGPGPVLHMDIELPARTQHAQQLGREIVHLAEEMGVVVAVTEVIIARGVLVLRREWHRRDDQADTVLGQRRGLDHGVVAPGLPVLARLERRAGAVLRRSGQYVPRALQAKAIGADDLRHARAQLVMLFPAPLEFGAHVALRFGVDNVDQDVMLLAEAVDTVDGLNEVAELEADAGEYLPPAMPLQVPARARDNGLGRQFLHRAGLEPFEGAGPLFRILRSIDADHARDRGLDREALGLEIVPDQAMCIGVLRAQLHDLRETNVDCIALLAARLDHADRIGLEQLALPVLFGTGRAVVRSNLVPPDPDRRAGIALVAVAKVGGLLHDRGPRIDPEPEFILLVRVDRELVRFLAVALEEPCFRLTHVHDAEERGIGEKLDIFVRARCRRCAEAIAYPVGAYPGLAIVARDRRHEFAERLGPAEPAQAVRFVERNGGEAPHVDLALAHALIIRDEGADKPGRDGAFDLRVASDKAQRITDALGVLVERAFKDHVERRDL